MRSTLSLLTLFVALSLLASACMLSHDLDSVRLERELDATPSDTAVEAELPPPDLDAADRDEASAELDLPDPDGDADLDLPDPDEADELDLPDPDEDEFDAVEGDEADEGDGELADGEDADASDGSELEVAEVIEPARVSEGLVALYLFNEGAGSEVLNQQGNTALDLSSSFALNWLSGRNGLRFDSQFLVARDSAALLTSLAGNAFTLEFWVTAPPAQNLVVGGNVLATLCTVPQCNFSVVQESAELHLRAANSTITAQHVIEPGAFDNVEHQYVVSWDGTELAIYRDDAKLQAGPANIEVAAWTPGQTFTVGAFANGGRSWRGEMYLLAIYDRALSAEERATNYAMGSRFP